MKLLGLKRPGTIDIPTGGPKPISGWWKIGGAPVVDCKITMFFFMGCGSSGISIFNQDLYGYKNGEVNVAIKMGRVLHFLNQPKEGWTLLNIIITSKRVLGMSQPRHWGWAKDCSSAAITRCVDPIDPISSPFLMVKSWTTIWLWLTVCHGKIHHTIKFGKPSITGPSIPWRC